MCYGLDWLIFYINTGSFAQRLAIAVEKPGDHTVDYNIEVESLAEL